MNSADSWPPSDEPAKLHAIARVGPRDASFNLKTHFTEIVCVCDATVRRQRIENLLRSRIIPGQETLFHFLTSHQLQTRLADIGQAAQKSGFQTPGGKAVATAVTMTKDDQVDIAQKQLAEIAQRRAKARAAKAAKG